MDFDINKDYYNILGVTLNASDESIRKSRDRRRFEEMAPISEWDDIEEAYRVLSNPQLRREYDNQLKLQGRYLESRNFTTGKEYMNYVNDRENNSLSSDNSATIEQPTEEIEQPTEEIEQPTEEIEQPTKEIEQPTEEIEQPTEEVEQPTEEVEPPTEEVEQPTEEVEPPTEEVEPPTEEVEQSGPIIFDKSKLKKATTIGAVVGFVFAGPLGAVGVGYLARKIKKSKLMKQSCQGTIKEVKSNDSRLDEQYNKQLKKEIDRILNGKYSDYNLEISKAKYENRIALTEAKIKLEKSIRDKKGVKAIQQLRITSLQTNLETLQSDLSKINEKLETNDKSKPDKLMKINTELEKVNNLIDSKTTEDQKNAVVIKALQVYKSILKLKQKGKITRKKIRTTAVRIFKDGTLRQIDKFKNFGQNIAGIRDLSSDIESVKENQESGRTR